MAQMVSSITVDIVVKVPNLKVKTIGLRLIALVARLFGIPVEAEARIAK